MEQNNQNAPISNGAVDPKAAVLQPGGPTQMVDKLQVDAQRNTIKEMRCVHIFWENKFVGIYNFSVFLLTKLGGASLRMKKTRNKQTAEYVVVGFPNARDSFEKFLPSWATLQFAADGHTYFMIPEEHMSDAELTNVFAQYTDWVAAIPLTPSKSEKEKENKNETQVSAPVLAPSANVGCIMFYYMVLVNDIMNFDLVNQSHQDASALIGRLQKKINGFTYGSNNQGS